MGNLFTVIVTEEGTPWPLVYTIDTDILLTAGGDIFIAARYWEDKILDAVAEERSKDTGDTAEILRAGLELQFAFEGDLPLALDWRG